MPSFFGHSSHMPCPECGASVEVRGRDRHECDPDRLHDYQLFHLRDEVAGLEPGISAFLDSPHGRFAQWLAERERS